MGKNEFLDAPGHSPSMSGEAEKQIGLLLLIFALIAPLLFATCSSIKIVTLKDPLTPEEHLNLGVAYERNGEFDHAIREYKLASKKLSLADFYLGNAYFLKNDLEAAENYYKKAMKKDPENADTYNNLAWLYYTSGKNLDKGEKMALKAIELNPAKKTIYLDTLEKIRELKRLQN